MCTISTIIIVLYISEQVRERKRLEEGDRLTSRDLSPSALSSDGGGGGGVRTDVSEALEAPPCDEPASIIIH